MVMPDPNDPEGIFTDDTPSGSGRRNLQIFSSEGLLWYIDPDDNRPKALRVQRQMPAETRITGYAGGVPQYETVREAGLRWVQLRDGEADDLYFVKEDGVVYAFDRKTGDPVNETVLGDGTGGGGGGGGGPTAYQQATLTQRQQEFAARLGLDERQFAEMIRQYNQNFERDASQYDTTLAQRESEFVRRFGLDVAQFAEFQRQYNQNFGEDQRQFDLRFGLEQRRFGEDQRQFDARLAFDRQRLAADMYQQDQNRKVSLYDRIADVSREPTDVGAFAALLNAGGMSPVSTAIGQGRGSVITDTSLGPLAGYLAMLQGLPGAVQPPAGGGGGGGGPLRNAPPPTLVPDTTINDNVATVRAMGYSPEVVRQVQREQNEAIERDRRNRDLYRGTVQPQTPDEIAWKKSGTPLNFDSWRVLRDRERGMAEGGMTTAREFIVGDSMSGAPTGVEERIKNPTGAPIEVIPEGAQENPLLAWMASAGMPRFPGGTDMAADADALVPALLAGIQQAIHQLTMSPEERQASQKAADQQAKAQDQQRKQQEKQQAEATKQQQHQIDLALQSQLLGIKQQENQAQIAAAQAKQALLGPGDGGGEQVLEPDAVLPRFPLGTGYKGLGVTRNQIGDARAFQLKSAYDALKRQSVFDDFPSPVQVSDPGTNPYLQQLAASLTAARYGIPQDQFRREVDALTPEGVGPGAFRRVI